MITSRATRLSPPWRRVPENTTRPTQEGIFTSTEEGITPAVLTGQPAPTGGTFQFFADGSPRPRWGDYGAAVADGKSIWVASEYIGQTCTFSQYLLASPTNKAAFGTCGDTRAALGNWDTRISQLVP